MPQLRDIKERISSVKKTSKMTQAMKMVAAAKFKRFSKQAISSRQILAECDRRLSQLSSNGAPNHDIPLMTSVDAGKELVVIISGDRGLCGGFNANILKHASQYSNSSDTAIEWLAFGKKAVQSLKKKRCTILSAYDTQQDKLTIDHIDAITADLVRYFDSNEYQRVTLLYSEFKTAVSSNLVSKQLLPVQASDSNSQDADDSIIIEPSQDAVLTYVARNYIKYALYNAFMESSAAEQGARMAAMDSATDNAKAMISDLTLIYNRQRQAQITTELSEIVAGAEALVN